MINFRKIVTSGVTVAMFGGLGFAQSVSADGVPRVELLASMCDTCHGPNGSGIKPNPGIAGEDPADFLELMQAYASGDEPTSIMDRHSQGYTEAELKALAEYFSKQ